MASHIDVIHVKSMDLQRQQHRDAILLTYQNYQMKPCVVNFVGEVSQENYRIEKQ